MNFNEMVKAVHQNAVEHGFWDNDREIYETYALIHSEWSEALEEDRAGREMVWYGENGKPEGVAIEMIDGVIRIMDYAGKRNFDLELINQVQKEESVPMAVCRLHSLTSNAYNSSNRYPVREKAYLEMCIAEVFRFIKEKGEDPEKLLLIKHEYNKGRAYKHGKKY